MLTTAKTATTLEIRSVRRLGSAVMRLVFPIGVKAYAVSRRFDFLGIGSLGGGGSNAGSRFPRTASI